MVFKIGLKFDKYTSNPTQAKKNNLSNEGNMKWTLEQDWKSTQNTDGESGILQMFLENQYPKKPS